MESVLEKKRKATVGYDVIFTEQVRYSDQLVRPSVRPSVSTLTFERLDDL